MPFSAENIIRNNPIPNLPAFNLNNNNMNQNNNNNNQNSIFDISESEKMNYKNIFDNQKEPNMESNAAPNINSSNTMFMSTNFPNNPNMNQNNNNNFNMMNSNTTINMSQSHSFNKKLHVQLTNEENILYNKLYNILDNNNQGRILAKPAANFMKKSGLDKQTLKNIWLIAAQTSNTQMDK